MSDEDFENELNKFKGVDINIASDVEIIPMDVKIASISRSGKIKFEFN